MQNATSQTTVADIKIENTPLKQETVKELNKSHKSCKGEEEPYSPTVSCFNYSSLINNYPDKSESCSISISSDLLLSKEDSIVDEIADPDWQNMKTYNGEFVREMDEAMQPFANQKPKNRVTTLTQMIIEELEDVSDDIFFDAKWKIIDILREAQAKQRLARVQLMSNGLNMPPGRFRTSSASSSSSSSVIIVQSPIHFPISPELNSSTPRKEVKLNSQSPTCPLYLNSIKTYPSKAATVKGKTINSESAGS